MSKKILFLSIIFIILLGTIWFFSIYLLQRIAIENTTYYSDSTTISNQISLETQELDNSSSNKEIINVELPNKKDITVSMSFIGDIMCHNTQFKDAYSNGTYDFSYVFSDIENYIQSADISVGNLETTFAGSEKGYSGYPNFNTPEALATDLAELGIDVLTTANNHSLDTGYTGIENTLNVLDNAGISHTGTSRSFDEQNTILYKDVNGLKFAFLAYTYGTNGNAIPSDKEYCINLINTDFISSQLELAKSENPDVICVCMHWGTEYATTPEQSQIDLANFLFENGVDIIIGNHPHVLEPMEQKTITLADGTEKNVFVIYSLGNFMSGQSQASTKTSVILNLKITKSGKTDNLSFDDISYIPIYTYTYPKYKNYKILDIQKNITDYENNNSSLSSEDYTNLKNSLNIVSSIFN